MDPVTLTILYFVAVFVISIVLYTIGLLIIMTVGVLAFYIIRSFIWRK